VAPTFPSGQPKLQEAFDTASRPSGDFFEKEANRRSPPFSD